MTKISLRFFRTYVGDDEPESLRVTSRHFSNLFEVPVLFYVVVLMTYVTGQVGYWLVGCAWVYVALRYARRPVGGAAGAAPADRVTVGPSLRGRTPGPGGR
jgi:hypothetical protein